MQGVKVARNFSIILRIVCHMDPKKPNNNNMLPFAGTCCFIIKNCWSSNNAEWHLANNMLFHALFLSLKTFSAPVSQTGPYNKHNKTKLNQFLWTLFGRIVLTSFYGQIDTNHSRNSSVNYYTPNMQAIQEKIKLTRGYFFFLVKSHRYYHLGLILEARSLDSEIPWTARSGTNMMSIIGPFELL